MDVIESASVRPLPPLAAAHDSPRAGTGSVMELRWISFATHGGELAALRRRVFNAEQGIAVPLGHCAGDEEGLHLCAFMDGRMVAALSTFIHQPDDPRLRPWQLPQVDGLLTRYGRYIVEPEHRGQHLAELLARVAEQQLYETVRPGLYFAYLHPRHHALLPVYRRLYGFEEHARVLQGDEETLVLARPPGEAARSYPHARARVRTLTQKFDVIVPSLFLHLKETGRCHLVADVATGQSNHYTDPLSLEEELPRLMAQNQLLFVDQRQRLSHVDLPAGPARLLDIGTGPGTYLQLLRTHECFNDYEVHGLEPSARLLQHASAVAPELHWHRGDAYRTGLPAAHFDVVHASFVFIHLARVDEALWEIERILKPGGVLCIVGPDEGSFRGPEPIAQMIREHDLVHEGDRRIAEALPQRATQFGLRLERRFVARLVNDGPEEGAEYSAGVAHVGRHAMWSFFGFYGQRKEIASSFSAARDHYFSTECEIEMPVQTLVFRKPVVSPRCEVSSSARSA